MDSKKDRLNFSFQGTWGAIRIGREVVKVLGEPEYICLRISEKKNTLAIRPCGPGDKVSFKVPPDLMLNKERKLRIYSKLFVRFFLESNHFDPEKTWSVDGEFSDTDHAVFFEMTKVMQR